jgi:hypothetical protein
MISDRDLAWMLAEATKTHLTDPEKAWVFVDLGCADYILAIERILTLVNRRNVPLRCEVLAEIRSWVHRYRTFADGASIALLLTTVPTTSGS